MRKLTLLFLLVFALLAGCNKDSGSATTDPGVSDTNGSTIAKSDQPNQPSTDPGQVDSDPGKAEPDPGKTNPQPEHGKGPTDPQNLNPKQHAPKPDPAKETTSTPTSKTYVGMYKMTRGLGEKAKMYLLELKDGGAAELKVTGVDVNAKPEQAAGKWSEKGGQLIIEWPNQAPMIFTLKDREMVSENFDHKKWEGKRVIFYKRA